MALRILRVINDMRVGGVQMRLLRLLPLLREMGAEPEVLGVRGSGPVGRRLESEFGVPTTVIKVKGRLHPRSIWEVARFIRRKRFHVVHTHMYQANISGTAAAWLARTPCIISQNHNMDMYRSGSQIRTDRWMMPFRDRFLNVSEAVRQNTAEHMGLPIERFGTLVNGVEIEPLVNPEPAPVVKESLGVPGDSLMIAHVARLHPQKGHRAFLKTFARIVESAPRAYLAVVGEGAELEDLQRLASELGMDNHTRFLGRRDDVARILTAADLSILPSEKEGFSNVVLESMIHGAALVISDVGGAREQLTDGVDGRVIAAGDAEAFADAVIELCNEDALRARFVEAARRRVQDFSLETMARRTLDLYGEVLKAKGKLPD